MRFNNNDDDDDSQDWFDGPDIEDNKFDKKPRLKPDDPKYYDEEESKWEHLKPARKRRFWMVVVSAAVIVALVIAGYIHFFGTYVEDATQYGYVESIETRGALFKTHEGVILPYKELMDTNRVYRKDFVFTAANKRIASQLKRWEVEVRPVRVQYKIYNLAMPWRGDSKIMVTAVDTVSPAQILPPDITPDYYRNRNDLTDTLDNNARQRRIDNSDLDEE